MAFPDRLTHVTHNDAWYERVDSSCTSAAALQHAVRLDHRDFNEGAHRFYKALGYCTYSVSMARRIGAGSNAR